MGFNDEIFDYQVLKQTDCFYLHYPNPPYKEILRKNGRSYTCLLIQSRYGYFICITYRSHINHKFAYRFKNSLRSGEVNSGLDYSKIVIITNSEYIEDTDAVVDKDEYNETRDNIDYIKNDAQRYIDNYIGFFQGKLETCDKKKFERTYQYSTLPYFHRELGLYNEVKL